MKPTTLTLLCSVMILTGCATAPEKTVADPRFEQNEFSVQRLSDPKFQLERTRDGYLRVRFSALAHPETGVRGVWSTLRGLNHNRAVYRVEWFDVNGKRIEGLPVKPREIPLIPGRRIELFAIAPEKHAENCKIVFDEAD